MVDNESRVSHKRSRQDVFQAKRALSTPQSICTEEPSGRHQPVIKGADPVDVPRECWTVVEVPNEDDVTLVLHLFQENLHLKRVLILSTVELRGTNCGTKDTVNQDYYSYALPHR